MKRSDHFAAMLLGVALAFGMPATTGVRAADLPPLSHTLSKPAPKSAPPLKLKDLDGTMHDLAKLRGKVVLINFWATWCPPCRREMPSMERLSQMLEGEAFTALAVNVGEDADTINAFTSQLDTTLRLPILLDSTSRSLQTWKVAGLPTTFLVDKQGRIMASAIGGREFDHPDIVEAIRGLLRK